MPLYEFKCRDCDNNFEELVSFSDLQKNTVECPECSSKNVKKEISTPSIGNDSCGTRPDNSGFT